MKKLTNKQAEILSLLKESPSASYQSHADNLGISKQSFYDRLTALEKKGYIKIIPHHIKILKSI